MNAAPAQKPSDFVICKEKMLALYNQDYLIQERIYAAEDILTGFGK